jgi:signal transduction histidine kinase
VGHDLRAPLRSIDGFSPAFIEEPGEKLAAGGQGHLERIRSSARQLERLSDDLLTLAKVRGG